MILAGQSESNEFANGTRKGGPKIRSEIGSVTREIHWQKPALHQLAGLTRVGTSIIIADLVYRAQNAQRGYEMIFACLSDMGWETTTIKIKRGNDNVTGRLEEAINEARQWLKSMDNDLFQVTVHVWLSMSFRIRSQAPLKSIATEDEMKKCAKALVELGQTNDYMCKHI
jgi:hypothetical protein